MKSRAGVAVALLALCSCNSATTRAAGHKMIVLGVDGMDPAFLERHFASLPNLNKLRMQGSFRRLATTIPPQSPVAWSSVITGMDPGGHGIYDFVHRDRSTRMPVSSMAEAVPPTRQISIGPYILPISGGGMRSLRSGRAFWQILEEHGVRSTVLRMPANFPPADCEGESLAGMGTPDLTGSFGTFTFYTDDPGERREKVPGGEIIRIARENHRATMRIPGPPNSLRADHPATSVSLVVDADPAEETARFELAGNQFILRQGEWSDWVRARYDLVPHVSSVRGIFRVYLQKVHPYLRVYVSPVNLDPSDPALPISTPRDFAKDVAEAVGPFYTQGIAEETSAFRAGIFTKAEFLTQSHKVLDDSLRLFRRELDRFSSGLLFYYFSSVDQNAHMLWGRYDSDLLDIYRAIDDAIGMAMAKAGADTTILVISDHGFASFDRAVHLNSLFVREGLMTLDDNANASDQELFPHVDWTRTLVYSIGLNAVYVNLDGREQGGVVPAEDRAFVLDRVAKTLLAFRDPQTGERVVERVYLPEQTYRGKQLTNAPDLLVGYRKGYRASWQTALGAVPKTTVEDNTNAWIGDHCMAAELVPGVFLSNRGGAAEAPALWDITATILAEFGVPKGPGMIGRNVFEDAHGNR